MALILHVHVLSRVAELTGCAERRGSTPGSLRPCICARWPFEFPCRCGSSPRRPLHGPGPPHAHGICMHILMLAGADRKPTVCRAAVWRIAAGSPTPVMCGLSDPPLACCGAGQGLHLPTPRPRAQWLATPTAMAMCALRQRTRDWAGITRAHSGVGGVGWMRHHNGRRGSCLVGGPEGGESHCPPWPRYQPVAHPDLIRIHR